MALLACARGGEAFDGEQPFAVKGTCLHIDLNFAGETPSKAANPDTPEVGGQSWENDIQTLSVFVRNRYDDTWAWDTIVRLYNVQQGKDYEVRLNKPLTASTKLYAAANISTAQETAFMQQVDNGKAYTLPGNDFRLVEDLAPYSTSETARRNTIAINTFPKAMPFVNLVISSVSMNCLYSFVFCSLYARYNAYNSNAFPE